MSQEENPEIIVEQSPTFKRIIITGIYGSLSPLGSEATIYSEYALADDILKKADLDVKKIKIKRMIECDLIINPQQMVAIRDWLTKKIDEYQNVFGKIPDTSEIQNRLQSFAKSKEPTSSESN
jgi:hypothetical protein